MLTIPEVLDMGVWADDGRVWLPKALCPSRNAAKMFAVHELGHVYIDVRVRSAFMRYEFSAPPEIAYEVCAANAPGAFPAWEIT